MLSVTTFAVFLPSLTSSSFDWANGSVDQRQTTAAMSHSLFMKSSRNCGDYDANVADGNTKTRNHEIKISHDDQRGNRRVRRDFVALRAPRVLRWMSCLVCS